MPSPVPVPLLDVVRPAAFTAHPDVATACAVPMKVSMSSRREWGDPHAARLTAFRTRLVSDLTRLQSQQHRSEFLVVPSILLHKYPYRAVAEMCQCCHVKWSSFAGTRTVLISRPVADNLSREAKAVELEEQRHELDRLIEEAHRLRVHVTKQLVGLRNDARTTRTTRAFTTRAPRLKRN